MTFQDQLKFGQIGEGMIARWFQSRGWLILPVYEKEIDTGKGPRVWSAQRTFVAPDLMALKDGEPVVWIEAKRKTVFSWHRMTRTWQTGIDKHHYDQYLALQETLWEIPIWLLFLHECATPNKIDTDAGKCPEACPVGLFGEKILKLKDCYRFHPNHGRHGMVYWREESLRLIAELQEVYAAAGSLGSERIT